MTEHRDQSNVQRFSWTQPCCNECWDELHPDRHPTRVLQTEDEICCFCGIATRSGIYVRENPETVAHPTLLKD